MILHVSIFGLILTLNCNSGVKRKCPIGENLDESISDQKTFPIYFLFKDGMRS